MFPGHCLFLTFELDQNISLGRRPIEGGYFVGPYDILSASVSQCCRSLIDDLSLKSGRIIYFPKGHDDISWRLHLGMNTLDSCSSNGGASGSAIAILYFVFMGFSLI